MASAVCVTLREWSLLDIVEIIVFDTTPSSLEMWWMLLEQQLDRDVLFLSCCHHITYTK